MTALARLRDEVGYDQLLFDDRIGKVSLIGAGMRTHPGVTAKFFTALASAGVNIEMISTSEIRISVIVDESQVDDAVAAAHAAFDLRLRRGRGRGLRRERAVSRAAARRRRRRHRPGRQPSCAGCWPSATSRSPSIRYFASARSAGTHAALARRRGRGRGRRHRRPAGLDIALFSAGASTSRDAGAALRRRRRARSSTTPPRGAGTPTSRWSSARSTPARSRQAPQGDHRQPQLHDDGRDAGAQAAARRGRAGPAGRLDLPGGLRQRAGRRRRARQAGARRWSTGPPS